MKGIPGSKIYFYYSKTSWRLMQKNNSVRKELKSIAFCYTVLSYHNKKSSIFTIHIRQKTNLFGSRVFLTDAICCCIWEWNKLNIPLRTWFHLDCVLKTRSETKYLKLERVDFFVELEILKQNSFFFLNFCCVIMCSYIGDDFLLTTYIFLYICLNFLNSFFLFFYSLLLFRTNSKLMAHKFKNKWMKKWVFCLEF